MGSVQTVALSGFNRDDETALRTWFDQVNKQLGEPFALIKDLNADVLIIDIDSIYGQMDWLRACALEISLCHRGEYPFSLLRNSEKTE